MVRTAAVGIRVSAGKSSKKVGGGNSLSSPSSGASKSKAGSSSSKLPPIPFQETPSWQKPITNFFRKDGCLKPKENKAEENNEKDNEKDYGIDSSEAGPSTKKLRLESSAGSDHEESIEVQESEQNGDETLEANKDNTAELDEAPSSSKD